MKVRRKTHQSFIVQLNAAFNGNISCLGTYAGHNMQLPFECNKCGARREVTPTTILRSGCLKCMRTTPAPTRNKSHNTFIEEISNLYKGTITIKDQYINSMTHVNVMCICGREWQATPTALLRGRGCVNCKQLTKIIGGNKRKTKEDFMQTLKDKRQDLLNNSNFDFTNMVYNGFSQRLDGVTCIFHGNIYPRPSLLLRGQGPCKECGMEATKKGLRKGAKYYITKCIDRHGDAYDYKDITDEKLQKGGTNQKFRIKHKKCGRILNFHLSNHLQGQGCKDCRKEKKRTNAERILKSLKI